MMAHAAHLTTGLEPMSGGVRKISRQAVVVQQAAATCAPRGPQRFTTRPTHARAVHLCLTKLLQPSARRGRPRAAQTPTLSHMHLLSAAAQARGPQSATLARGSKQPAPSILALFRSCQCRAGIWVVRLHGKQGNPAQGAHHPRLPTFLL